MLPLVLVLTKTDVSHENTHFKVCFSIIKYNVKVII